MMSFPCSTGFDDFLLLSEQNLMSSHYDQPGPTSRPTSPKELIKLQMPVLSQRDSDVTDLEQWPGHLVLTHSHS